MDYEAKHRSSSPSASTKHVNLKRIDNSIYFSDKITYESAHLLTCLLRTMESDMLEDLKAAEADLKKSKSKYIDIKIDPKPINLYLTTHGGLVHAAFSIVDCIKSLKIPVNTYVLGYVASAGTLISLAGQKRYISPNSYMMIHEIRSGMWGRFSDIRVEHENITKLMDHIVKYYVDNTKITKEKLTEMLRTDTDLSAEECLTMGLVDTIQK